MLADVYPGSVTRQDAAETLRSLVPLDRYSGPLDGVAGSATPSHGHRIRAVFPSGTSCIAGSVDGDRDDDPGPILAPLAITTGTAFRLSPW
jgi:hypothetical protein